MTDFANNVAIIKAVVAKELLKKDFTGREGDKGEKGDKGETGDKGESIVGPQGPVGKAGRDGVDGLQGPVGKAGKDGRDGTDGRDGIDGQSIEGPEGPVGKAGQDGQDGRDGRGIKSIKVNDENMLVVTYDDGDMTIAGKVSVTNKTEVIQNGAGLPLGHFAIHSVTIDDDKQLIVKCNNNKTFVIPTLRAIDIGGFADYNDTSSSATPVTLDDNVWTDIPNNGLGSFTNKTYAPDGVTEFMDDSTGYIDTSELELGDTILIRNDYKINPNTNNALLEFRYELGGGGGIYNLEKIVGRLDAGSGVDYRFNLNTDLIYMGDLNTKDNPIKLQVRLSTNGSLLNAGSVIQLIKRDIKI